MLSGIARQVVNGKTAVFTECMGATKGCLPHSALDFLCGLSVAGGRHPGLSDAWFGASNSLWSGKTRRLNGEHGRGPLAGLLSVRRHARIFIAVIRLLCQDIATNNRCVSPEKLRREHSTKAQGSFTISSIVLRVCASV